MEGFWGSIRRRSNLAEQRRIITSGDHSPAVFNQSIGGGGGRVSRVNGTAHLGSKETLRSSFLNSGELSIRNEGQLIATEGNLSPAIVSQTIGGGGGWLGISTDDLKLGSSEALGDQSSGDLVLTNKGHLITRGVASGGILAQSIGGGGGYTAFANGSLQLGALNSHGVLSAGRIELKNSSSIRTDGKNSPGIVATGVAGGGGFVAGQTGEIVNVVHLGGSGQTVSKADRLRIKLDRSSEVITNGHNSPGVLGSRLEVEVDIRVSVAVLSTWANRVESAMQATLTLKMKDEFLPEGITPMVLLHKASEAVEEQHSSVIDVLFLVQPMDPMETQDL